MADMDLLIPFDGGLDSFSNPHRLGPGTFTAATGVALNRHGYAYPGPGYNLTSPFSVASGTTSLNHGISAYTGRTFSNTDGLVLWQSTSDTTANVPSSTNLLSNIYNATDGSVPGPLPFRQAQTRIAPSLTLGVGVNMSLAPQSVTLANYRVFAYLMGGYTLSIIFQDLNTGIVSPVYGGNATSLTVGGGGLPFGANSFALAGDGQSTLFIYLAINGTGAGGNAQKVLTVTVPSTGLTATIPATLVDISGTFSTINNVVGCNGRAVFACNNAGSLVLNVAGTATTTAIITSLTATSPITMTYDAVGNQWLCAGVNSTNDVVVNTATLSGGVFTPGTPTTFTFSANIPAGSVVKQIAMCRIGVTSSYYIALEYNPGTRTIQAGQAYTYNEIACYDGSHSKYSTIQAWGGAALVGKPASWTWAPNKTDVLLPIRTGWRHYDGAWGSPGLAGTAPAYPTGYIYNLNNHIVAKFGDGDVGTDGLYPEFASANYVTGFPGAYNTPSLGALPEPSFFTTGNGQPTLTWPFPQYDHLLAYSISPADYGAAYGTAAALSSVELIAPTAAEPPAPMVQFGNTIIVPGSLTMNFDGVQATEAGFLHPAPTPSVRVVSASGTSAGLPVGSAYYYRAIIYYLDAAGSVHYSAPSNIVLSPNVPALSSSGIGHIFEIIFPGMTQTYKQSYIKLYRSLNVNTTIPMSVSGITWYEVPGGLVGNNNNSAAFGGYIADPVLDTTLANCGQLYTSGMATFAAVGTGAPPAFDCLALWNNTVWGVSNRNGPELWFTWPLSNFTTGREGPAWSQANRIPLPAEIGQPKAIVGMDSGLIILGTKADYLISGSGPNRSYSYLDDTNCYTAPTVLPTPGGIKVLNGITKLPSGILFQGQQGFTLLDRSLQYELVGMPINDLAQANLYLPGVYIPGTQAVALYASSSATADLLYFYNNGLWSQCEHPPSAPGSGVAGGPIAGSSHAVAGNTSTTYLLPSTGTYVATVQPYSAYISFRTSWINMTNYANGMGGGVSSTQMNLASYGMLREVQVLGEIPNQSTEAYTLTLKTEYDYEGNTAQPSDNQTITSGGTTANRDSQWRFGFSAGNARRVRFTVTFNAGVMALSPLGNNPAVLFSGIELLYSVDPGLSRVGAANSSNIA